MKGVKIGTLFLVAIMSLAGVGASYANWTQSVDINTTATTGNFDFQITDIAVNNANGATITPAKYDDHTWYVTISGTYPGWIGYITVTNKNAGTVPLKFYSFQITNLVADDWTMSHAYTLKFYPPSSTTPNIYGNLYDFQNLQYYETTWGVPASAITLNQGATHDSLVSLELDPALTGHYGSTVTFTFEMTAIQTTP